MEIAKRLYRMARAGALGELAQKYGRPFERDWGDTGATAGAPVGEVVAEQHVDERLAKLYANLELPYGSNEAAVHAAWRRLLKQYHPDRHSTDSARREVANELTVRLTAAYEELTAAIAAKGKM